MILTEVGGYRGRKVASKCHREEFSINKLTKELLFFLNYLGAACKDDHEIHQRFDGEEDHKLDHDYLAKITSIIYEIE